MLNRIYRAALACTLLLLLLPALAHADGGAPNLAYVAGGDKGISVIDIKQEKVTGTITPTGNPHTVLLSLDGSYLYVTQPQQGQVAILKANNGDPVCTADVPALVPSIPRTARSSISFTQAVPFMASLSPPSVRRSLATRGTNSGSRLATR